MEKEETYEEKLAKLQVEQTRFESDLRQRIKRFHPRTFASSLIKLHREICNGRKGLGIAAPFKTAYLIEANCAYHTGSHQKQLDFKSYKALYNLMVNRGSTASAENMGYDLQLWILHMHRQQLEFQTRICNRDLTRISRIFLGEWIDQTSKRFSATHGCTLAQWFQGFMAILAAAEAHEFGEVGYSGEVLEKVGLDAAAQRKMINLLSVKPSDIRKNYLDARSNVKPFQQATVRSVFFGRPIMDFGDGKYCVPFPSLLAGAAEKYITDWAKGDNVDTYSNEFGAAFEKYTYEMCGETARAKSVFCPDKQSEGEFSACDILLNYDSHVVLIECKFVGYTHDRISKTVVRKDRSTQEISKGISQLSATALKIKLGDYEAEGVSRSAKIVGFVVCYSPVPFANAPDYIADYLEPETADGPGAANSFFGSIRPAIVSIDTLETMICKMRSENKSFLDLIVKKQFSNYHSVGDWDTFAIPKADRVLSGNFEHSYFDAGARDFYEKIGMTFEGVCGSQNEYS